ncbi:MAG: formylglycine-generating enzyme family protein, partial [Chloroflexi bacterium]|nr:formylglycine-generating enzyme family protein [Chloroflexota bacterium]
LNQPVVGVSYYEAEAFCRWLSAIDEKGLQYRLPTEEEWEAMARGPQGREYPWGNEWQEGVSNTEEAGLGATCGVGLFPGGKSPHGAHDCAGNVWEWCVDWIDEQKRYKRVKGGTWAWGKGAARCGARNDCGPGYSYASGGFRVVAPIS